jgi:hypothetical protein
MLECLDYRAFISIGVLVAALSIDAQLARDGVIELWSLDVERYPFEGYPQDAEE